MGQKKKTDYIIFEGSKRINSLYDGSNSYKIEDFLGSGKFGDVIQCVKSGTEEKVAIKVMGEYLDIFAEQELTILEEIKKLDGDKNNLVKFSHHFIVETRFCLAFEMLDMSLHQMMLNRRCTPLDLSQIRVITQQMLVALNALKSIDFIHTDIKPDNIMLVNHESYPFKVKLIDFGNALPVSQLQQGQVIQNVGYRAPESYLGLPMNEGVDMWALACVLAFLYLGQPLYPLDSEYEAMRVITQMHGQTDDQTLSSGLHTKDFFTKDEEYPTAPWRLYTRDEYISIHHSAYKNKPYKGFSTKFTSLDDITKIRWRKKGTKYEDNQAFLSLLSHMLQVDPKNRITPSEALGHSFITMKHFPSDINDKYVKSAFSTIDKCMLCKPSEEDIACLEDTHPADEVTTANTTNGPPATDDKTTAARADRTLHETNVTNSPSSTHRSNGVNISNNDKGPKKVKRWRKWFSMFSCKKVDVIE